MSFSFFRRRTEDRTDDAADECLVRIAAGGEDAGREAFRVLADRHRLAIRTFLRARLRQPDREEEILQQTLVSAWEHVDQCAGAFRPWLMTIAANKVRDGFRAARARPEETDPAAGETVVASVDVAAEALAAQAQREVIALIGQILARDYGARGVEIALRRWMDGWSSKEIADVFGLTPNAVDQRLFQMKKRLRESEALRRALQGTDPASPADASASGPRLRKDVPGPSKE